MYLTNRQTCFLFDCRVCLYFATAFAALTGFRDSLHVLRGAVMAQKSSKILKSSTTVAFGLLGWSAHERLTSNHRHIGIKQVFFHLLPSVKMAFLYKAWSNTLRICLIQRSAHLLLSIACHRPIKRRIERHHLKA